MRVRWLKTTAGYGLLVSSLLTASLDAGAQELQPVGNPLATVAASPPPRVMAAGDVQDESERGETPATQDAAPAPPAAPAQPAAPTQPSAVQGDATPAPATGPTPDPNSPDNSKRMRWLDRTHQDVYDAVWLSSMHVDRWFGSERDEEVYQHGAYGSLAPALLWDQYNHLRTMLRFNANFPLPQIDERFHAFVGRVNPEEFISERDEPSGAFQRQYGPNTEDQTIFGLSFHQPSKQGGYFDFGAGVRIATPMDPYIKGSYVFERGASERGLLSLRETLFWDNSDGVGVTSRMDLEHIFNLRWLVRWTVSGTVAQETQGTRGYTAVLAMRGFPNRHAIALEIGMDGETKAPVPLHDYGMKVAYRQSIARRWLIMEIRTSVDWPKDFIDQHRSRSFGVGIGFEMLFGTEEFLARPVTF